ncbi:MAG: SRPBCC family protein [Bacteroidales bacterium]|nr:SRPBCC family protein [Candidatus Colicola faecequi]
MSEQKYESKITSSTQSAHDIFRVMSDLRNIDKVKDLIPKDKIKEILAEEDNIRIKVDGLGPMIGIRILDKEEDNVIKYGLENIPMEGYFWVQMKQVAPGDTRMKLTIKADMPMMIKMMVEKKLQQGLDQAAEMLAQMPFGMM